YIVCRDQRRERDFVVLEGLEQVLRVKTDHVIWHRRATYPRVHKGVKERVDVAARHDEERGIVEIELVVKDHDEVLGKEGRVGFHHALGLAGCPARIHD